MFLSALVVPVDRFEGGLESSHTDSVAVEEPLEIRLNGAPLSVTMRTPGDDVDLAIGFLVTEGIILGTEQIVSIRRGEANPAMRRSGNVIDVQLHPGADLDLSRLARNFHATSSCGICGKAAIESVLADVPSHFRASDSTPMFHASVIHGLPPALRQAQAIFDRTGGLHAAALFDTCGNILALREDVGRHNAVDKLIGYAASAAGRLSVSNCLMFVSGRAGFELVQKAAMARIPVLAAVGAPSSLAVEAALRFGMTLLGFVRGNRFNSYSNSWRIQ